MDPRGPVRFVSEGKSFTLLLDFNAICDFGEQLQVNGLERLNILDKKPLGAAEMRALFWAGLQEHHPEVSLREAGRMVLDHAEDLGRAMAAMMAGLGAGNVPSAPANRAEARATKKRRR